MMVRHQSLLSCLLITVILARAIASEQAARGARIGLHASWPWTSPCFEAAEWIGSHASVPDFWRFIDLVAARESDQSPSELSDRDLYARVDSALRRLFRADSSLSDISVAAATWALSAHIMSARVDLHRTLALEALAAFDLESALGDAGRPFIVFAPNNPSHVALVSDFSQLGGFLKGLCTSSTCKTESNSDLWLTLDDQNSHVLALLPDDRVYSTPDCAVSQLPTIHLYADPLDPYFRGWHELIRTAADACDVTYVLRFWDGVEKLGRQKPALQGYSVEIALKSTEYKVVDDLVFTPKLFPDSRYGLPFSGSEEREVQVAVDGKVDLSALESDDAGVVAATFIISEAQNDPFAALSAVREMVEDIPVTIAHAKTMTSKNVAGLHSVRSSAEAIGSIPTIVDSIFVNGRRIEVQGLAQDLMPPLACVAGIARTGQLLRDLFRKCDPSRIDRVPDILRADSTIVEDRLRLDYAVGGQFPDVPVWFNNIQKDKRYATWKALDLDDTTSVAWFVKEVKLAESSSAAGLAQVRENFLSLIVALDPGNIEHLAFLSLTESVVYGMLPIRLGIILVPTGRPSILCTAVFYYCLELGGIKLANKFLRILHQIMGYYGSGMHGLAMSEPIVNLIFQETLQGRDSLQYSSPAQVVEMSASVRSQLLRNRQWAIATGVLREEHGADENWDALTGQVVANGASTDNVPSSSARLVGLLNGIVLEDIAREALDVARAEQKRIAAALESRSATLSKTHGGAELSSSILSDESFIFVTKVDPGSETDATTSEGGEVVRKQAESDRKDLSLAMLAPYAEDVSKISYMDHEEGEVAELGPNSANITVTVWYIAKEGTATGAADARAALDFMFKNGFARRCGARVAVLDPESKLARFILRQVRLESKDEAVFVVNGAVIRSGLIPSGSDLQAIVAKEALSLGSSAARAASATTDGDVVLYSRLALRETDEACGAKFPSMQSGHSNTKIPSFAKTKEALQGQNLKNSPLLLFRHSPAALPTVTADLDILLIIDPLGLHAREASTFIEAMLESVGRHRVDFTLLLRPQPGTQLSKHQVPCLFSRFVLSTRPSFHAKHGTELSPGASFHRLPQTMLLTVGLTPPRPWFVAPFSTNYDLDNIILGNLGAEVRTLHGEYVLESLLVEGSCIDEQHGPPQGLRLQMTGLNHSEIDTIVMANLGYFQLKTPRPGRWRLHLAPGRSRDIYGIQRIETFSIFGGQGAADRSTFSSDKSGQIFVLVDSLLGARDTLLRVRRKPGMEDVPLLDPANTSATGRDRRHVGALVSRFVERIYRSAGKVDSEDASVTGSSPRGSQKINVFSVASGHLYERFLKIMMLSAAKHASVPIKFWLLENYLSPSFKRIVPSFAAEHGFEVEMVTYRWPAWLREQTEKQRIIWAYKILFLDVLFPLNLSRVIFVDSDQVVRGDLVELMRLDLQGAPYGYVPFCDSRKEVEGFRFWKSGFWKDTLRGAPYHISALYVVDLDTFRETSAGDSLRYMYQSLSADPNSLSNLDQDLPNYAAFTPMAGNVVPIFHLPQEWLWCESWCDDASKEKAKTIDLCNNPMTKEPKLTSAKRIIGEWVELDGEATRTTRRLHEQLSSMDEFTRHSDNVDQENMNGATMHVTEDPDSASSEAKDEL